MVVDIGGGSTDIAVISMGGRVKAASVPVAGNAFDRCIAQYVQEKFLLSNFKMFLAGALRSSLVMISAAASPMGFCVPARMTS